MAFTGIEIYRTFQQVVAQSYTGFLSPTKASRLLKKSLYNSIEDKYRQISSREDVKAYDEIRTYIVSGQLELLTNNFTSLFTGSLSNYMRMLAVRAYYRQVIYTINITAQSATTPAVITLSNRSNFRNELVFIPNVGEVWLRKLNSVQFAVYGDQNFQTPLAITVNVINQKLERVFYEFAKQLTSTEKISKLINPSPDNPYYEITAGGLLLHPTDIVCSEMKIDYIRKCTEIDPTSSFDYETEYPTKFIEYIIDKAAILFGGESRDSEEIAIEQQQIQQNP